MTLSEQSPNKQLLTRELTQAHMRQHAGSPKALIISTSIIVGAFLLFALIFLLFKLWVGVGICAFLALLFGCGFAQYFPSTFSVHRNEPYRLVEAVCTKKQKVVNEGPTTYTLWFGEHGPFSLIYPVGWPHSSLSIYDQTEVGDTCYLLLQDPSRIPFLIYSTTEWTIDDKSFRKEGIATYIPLFDEKQPSNNKQ